jgi:hypothetical protein
MDVPNILSGLVEIWNRTSVQLAKEKFVIRISMLVSLLYTQITDHNSEIFDSSFFVD